MMRQTIGFVVMGSALLLGGCVFETSAPKRPVSEPQSEVSTMNEPGRVAQWAQALASGKRLQCTSVTTGGAEQAATPLTITITLEKDQYRIVTQSKEGSTVMVYDGASMYTWNEGEKQGIKIAKDCMAALAGSLPDSGTEENEAFAETPEAVLADHPDMVCEEGGDMTVAVPGDVAFTDQCQVMQESLRMMEQYEQPLPNDFQTKGAARGPSLPE